MFDKVLLVSSVGFTNQWLPINILQLQQYLANHDIDADCLYLSVLFSDYICKKYPCYKQLNEDASEWGYSFQEQYFANKVFRHNNSMSVFKKMRVNQYLNRDIYYNKINKGDYSFVKEIQDIDPVFQRKIAHILKYCEILKKNLENTLSAIDFKQYCLVGFSCNQAQFFSSLYCSHQIKSKYNDKIKIVFGGPMFEGWNVKQYKDNFPIIDYIIVGSGEENLLNLIKRKFITKKKDIKKYPYKEISNLLKRPHNFEASIMASKGCSWGKCRFCNLDNNNFYECRNPDIILDEIRYLVREYNIYDFNFCDMELNGNLVNLKYLCRLIIKSKLILKFWAEINSKNTSPSLFKLMKNAGMTYLQCGIESFSSSLLNKMKKQSSLLDNVKTIKWAYEAKLDWFCFNLIAGFPLEDIHDLEETLDLIEKIKHLLKSPIEVEVVELDLFRNSVLYKKRRSLGINIKGNESYEFDKACIPKRLNGKFLFPLVKYINRKYFKKWIEINDLIEGARIKKYKFYYKIRKTHIDVYDTRIREKRHTTLNGKRAETFESLNEKPIKTKELASKINYSHKNDLDVILNDFESRKWIIKDGSTYFGLATETP